MDSSRAETVQVGRPSKRSPELAKRICSSLAQGFSLRFICAEENISQPFVFDWLYSDPEFYKQYVRARETQAETLADVIVELSDSAIGKAQEVVTAIRNAVDARKWVAAKLLPKKYGDIPNQTNFNQTIVIPVLSQEKQQELQERKRKLLEG